MKPKMLTIPQETLEQIVSYLPLESFMSLRCARLELLKKTSGESTSRIVVKGQLRHSREGQKAHDGAISYPSAVQRAFERRRRFAQGRPSSVMVLGYGTDFIYQEGTLCYTDGNLIRILNVHGSSNLETVFDLKQGLAEEADNLTDMVNDLKSLGDEYRCRPINYHNGILACGVFSLDRTSHEILVWLDTKAAVSKDLGRRIKVIWGDSYDSQRQVLHTMRSNWWYNGANNDHNLWVIDLESPHYDRCYNSATVEIKKFFHDSVGNTSLVCKIYGEWIYLLCVKFTGSAVSKDIRSSHYYCARLPADDPQYLSLAYPPRVKVPLHIEHAQIWRETLELELTGDFVPNLELHEDERTGSLIIVERRQGRFSLQPLVFTETSRTEEPTVSQSFDSDGRLHTLPSHWCHSDSEDPILHRKYNLACSACLDLSLSCPDTGSSTRRHQGISLHIASRTRASPLGNDGLLLDNVLDKSSPGAGESAEDYFSDNASTIWPPPDSPDKLLQLLNTTCSQTSAVDVRSDERSVVYSTGPSDSTDSDEAKVRKIVLINFDPYIRYPGLKRMELYRHAYTPNDKHAGQAMQPEGSASRNTESKTEDAGEAKMPWNSSAEKAKEPDLGSEHMDEEGAKGRLPWFRTERAMWVDIGKGFEFH